MKSELSLWRRVILIGLAIALVPTGFVLPWAVHQLGRQLPDGSWRRGLTFSAEFVPSTGHVRLDWTDFSRSFVWRGDLYFVETLLPVDSFNASDRFLIGSMFPHRPARRLLAWNLATGQARVVAPCAERMMYFVHDDQLVVLNLPTQRLDVTWRDSLRPKRVSKWRFVGPFDFNGAPSVLAVDDGNVALDLHEYGFDSNVPRIPPSATLLSHKNGHWIERGDVPLPQTFADWNGRLTDVFSEDGETCIECRIGWESEWAWPGAMPSRQGVTVIRRGLFPPLHSWDDDESNAVRRTFPPLWWFLSAADDEPVSALLPENASNEESVAGDAEGSMDRSVPAVKPENMSYEDWREILRNRERWEAAAVNQPASALDPENRPDWRGWPFDDSDRQSNDFIYYDGSDATLVPRLRSAAELRFAAQDESRMLMRYSMHSSPAYFSTAFSGPLAYAQRQDRSRPRRLSCIVLRNDKSDRTFLGNMSLNGNRLVINNDGRDILNGTQVVDFGEIHTQVIAVEALDDSAVWLVGRRSDGRIDLHRLDEQGSHRVGSVAGPLRGMIARQVGLLLVLVAAVPALLFVIVGFGLVRGRGDRTYSFGHRTVQLAPVGRRGLARLIDVAVILLPLAAGLLLSPEFGTWWSKCHGIVVSEKGWFLHLLAPNGTIRWTEARQLAQRLPSRILEVVHAAPVGWLAVALGGASAVASCVAKARWGMALGGWLCGVRVWRKTLRPCGLPRCLLRELLLIGETLGGWLWLSPLLMLALSNQSRRWGDRISDTIVVRTDRVGSKNVRTESPAE